MARKLLSTEGRTGLNHSLDDCLGVPNSRDIAVHDGLVAEGYYVNELYNGGVHYEVHATL